MKMNVHSTSGSRLPRRVDRVDVLLEGAGAVEHAGVGDQVDGHVRADGDESAERMQAANHELVPSEKRLRGTIHVRRLLKIAVSSEL